MRRRQRTAAVGAPETQRDGPAAVAGRPTLEPDPQTGRRVPPLGQHVQPVDAAVAASQQRPGAVAVAAAAIDRAPGHVAQVRVGAVGVTPRARRLRGRVAAVVRRPRPGPVRKNVFLTAAAAFQRRALPLVRSRGRGSPVKQFEHG